MTFEWWPLSTYLIRTGDFAGWTQSNKHSGCGKTVTDVQVTMAVRGVQRWQSIIKVTMLGQIACSFNLFIRTIYYYTSTKAKQIVTIVYQLQEPTDLSSMNQSLSASRDFVVVMLHTTMKFLGQSKQVPSGSGSIWIHRSCHDPSNTSNTSKLRRKGLWRFKWRFKWSSIFSYLGDLFCAQFCVVLFSDSALHVNWSSDHVDFCYSESTGGFPSFGILREGCVGLLMECVMMSWSRWKSQRLDFKWF